MDKEDLSIIILNEKIDLMKSELEENKLYLELCFVALLIIIFGYFKTELGQQAISSASTVGLTMIVIVLGLYVGIVYFFYSVIMINNKNKKLINEKIDFLSKK
ncbi:hypothetical protein C0585_06485 [Candidatus Woesearchaeota archaeon]|nr:MAG: hypothetical protein C0585_06485 [Candidatus Woesearchaeota archaeon]